jgi:hypothetical protein
VKKKVSPMFVKSCMLLPSTKMTGSSFSASSFVVLGRSLTATFIRLLKLGCTFVFFFLSLLGSIFGSFDAPAEAKQKLWRLHNTFLAAQHNYFLNLL